MSTFRLLTVFIIAVLMTASLTAQSDCAVPLAPRLSVGGSGAVVPGVGNNVRESPSPSGEYVGWIAGGDTFTVLEGPICSANFVWWRVESGDVQGWTAEGRIEEPEYFVMPISGTFFHFEEVIFDIPAELASNAGGNRIAIETDEDDPNMVFIPEHTVITFEGYTDDNFSEFELPEMRIYRSDSLTDVVTPIGAASRQVLADLPTYLQERPILYDALTATDGLRDIPDVRYGAKHGLMTNVEYLDFENGSGIRFVTYYTQAPIPADNTNLLYRFMGITDDRSHIVSGTFPIDIPELPPTEDYQNSETDILLHFLYAPAAELFIENIAEQEFTPDLAQLDALIQTLYVGDQ